MIQAYKARLNYLQSIKYPRNGGPESHLQVHPLQSMVAAYLMDVKEPQADAFVSKSSTEQLRPVVTEGARQGQNGKFAAGKIIRVLRA